MVWTQQLLCVVYFFLEGPKTCLTDLYVFILKRKLGAEAKFFHLKYVGEVLEGLGKREKFPFRRSSLLYIGVQK